MMETPTLLYAPLPAPSMRGPSWTQLVAFVIVVLWLGMLWPRRGTPAGEKLPLWRNVSTVGQEFSIRTLKWAILKLNPRPTFAKGTPTSQRVKTGKAYSGRLRMTRLCVQHGFTVLVAVIVPIAILRLARRSFRQQGLGPPNRLGWRIVLVAYVVALPFVLIMALDPRFGDFYQKTFKQFWPAMGQMAFILFPEHISFQGWGLALLLPTLSFPEVSLAVAPVGAPWWKRTLMWMGLAQPTRGRWYQRALGWAGIDTGTLLAMFLSGTHFCIAHAGKPGIEIFFSFSGGMGLAYVAVRSRSLWTCFLLHTTTGLTALLILAIRHGLPT